MAVCKGCDEKCGKGAANVPPPKNTDGVFVALCKIACETRSEICKGKHKGKKPSSVAESKAKNDPRLQKAIDKRYKKIGGGKAAVNKGRFVKYNNMPSAWKRAKVAQKTLDRQLDKIEKQIKKKATKLMATKAAKKAASSWMKFVPILNVVSTAYDVYDLASTGYDIYDQFKQAREQFSGDVYRTRPDVAIEGPNGKLQDIYDFKMDNPETGYQDKWQRGQEQLYRRDLKDSTGVGKDPNVVSCKSCGCDGQPCVGS
jgi:hypothetical protein